MSSNPRLLVIDDDAELCGLVSRFLGGEGFQVDTAHSAADGLARERSVAYALVVLDVMLPDLNGIEALRRLRAGSATPVLILTARGDAHDRVLGLEMGADDYLPKPFEAAELAARIRAILRRAASAESNARPSVLTAGNLELDRRARSLTRGGTAIGVTGVEFDLLDRLMRAPGEVISRETLVREVLGREFSPFDRSLDTHVCNLRHKLGRNADGSDWIRSVRGVGYLLAVAAVRR